jgi:hypothetical protein
MATKQRQKPKLRQAVYAEELQKLREYISSTDNEDAKRPLLYPLFHKLFRDKFLIESNANGADVYIKGKLIVECKTEYSQWLEGFYQALHYHKRHGLVYNTIIVIAHNYIAIWKVNKLPVDAAKLAQTTHSYLAPNKAGSENARKTSKKLREEIKDSAFYWLDPKQLGNDHLGGKSLTIESYEVLKILNNLESDRLQINTHNFIETIESLKSYFNRPIDAVHAFYTVVAYWDIGSTAALKDNGDVQVVGFGGHHISDVVKVPDQHIKEFAKFIETHYIFTNEGSGITVDYYFSRFDEVIARLDSIYVKQHGIFFTDSNLSRFALWFAKNHFPNDIDENYIVFDPAGGSGNLISSWRGKLKHKIISELQPDLLRTIERRMKVDPWHVEKGFTIIQKTSENKGLNFLDKEAKEYLTTLQKELKYKNIQLDKPIAFLLNPPYKNTDENEKVRKDKEAAYEIHNSILEVTGDDAGKERYMAFLGQILNISKEQVRQFPDLKPVVMIFTPTSWLIPRPSYRDFRKKWDQNFHFHSGFLITSNEFFSLKGSWPLAFTIWVFDHNESGNEIKVLDLTGIKKHQLNINWNLEDPEINFQLNDLLEKSQIIALDNSKGDIKSWVNQSMYDFKRDPTKKEKLSNAIYGGLPLTDERRANKKTYGVATSSFIGFMDDGSPVRVGIKDGAKFALRNNSIWFRLDSVFKDMNKSKCFNGPQDKYSYCAFDYSSAKLVCTWFALTKVLNGRYPLQVNQIEIWPPKITLEHSNYWYALCFAFVLAENRCVVTIYEADNPVKGAPEAYVDNPLCPTNSESFWSTTLAQSITSLDKSNPARLLVDKITELYKYWNFHYCSSQVLENVGLKNEPYFKYFSYPDFLTPYSGLIQIEKYANNEGLHDVQAKFEEVKELTKRVKEELYRLLINEFKYFD